MSFKVIVIINLFFILIVSCGVKSPPVSKNHIPSFDSNYKKSLIKDINFNSSNKSEKEDKKSLKQVKNNEAQQ